MTISELADLFTYMTESGHGEDYISAEHDVIYIPLPADDPKMIALDKDSDSGNGVHLDEDTDSWRIFV